MIGNVRHAAFCLNVIGIVTGFHDRERNTRIGEDVLRMLGDPSDINDGPATLVHAIRRDRAEGITCNIN